MNIEPMWNIDKSKLADYRKNEWNEDYFIATPNNKYGILVYNIDEFRMSAYAGFISIYSNPKDPKQELNSYQTWIWFDEENTFDFLERSGCIVCRKPVSTFNPEIGTYPFLLINMDQRIFGFIEFDYTSIYYGIDEVEAGKAILTENHPGNFENMESEKRTGEIFDLREIEWFNLYDFDRAEEKYRAGRMP